MKGTLYKVDNSWSVKTDTQENIQVHPDFRVYLANPEFANLDGAEVEFELVQQIKDPYSYGAYLRKGHYAYLNEKLFTSKEISNA